MTAESTGSASRPADGLAAEVLAEAGGVVATACDRFSLHPGDPGPRAVARWIRRTGDGQSGRTPDVGAPFAWTDLAGAVRDRLRRHGLEGWCVLFPRSGAPDRGIGLDVSQVHAFADLLCSPDDVLFASSARRWRVDVRHEGGLRLWGDVDWGARDGIR